MASSLETSHVDASGWHDHGTGGSHEGDYIDWLTIRDLEESVALDVKRIRDHPLVPGRIPIYGFVYECATGRLIEVSEAMKAGKTN